MYKYITFIIVFFISINSFAQKTGVNPGDLNQEEYRELEKIVKAAKTTINVIEVTTNDNELENSSKHIAVEIENENITGLRIYGQNITSLNIIKNLVNLKTLIVMNCNISKIEGLDKLVNLNTLMLTGNKISKIEGFDKLVNLNVLGLNGNKIKKIEGLDNLVNLEKIGLGSNEIIQIKGLDKLVNLKELYLNYNKIHTINELEKLIQQLPDLWIIDLKGNFLDNNESFTLLEKLDNENRRLMIRITGESGF